MRSLCLLTLWSLASIGCQGESTPTRQDAIVASDNSIFWTDIQSEKRNRRYFASLFIKNFGGPKIDLNLESRAQPTLSHSDLMILEKWWADKPDRNNDYLKHVETCSPRFPDP